MFLLVSVIHSVQGGACVVAPRRGVHGFIGGHAWFYSGGVRGFIWRGMHGFIWGVCMVLFGGVCMVLFGGCAWFYSGGCVWFYSGGCAWFYLGGMRGFIRGGSMRVFFSFFGYNEIRSMSGRYASYRGVLVLLKF